MDFGDISGPTPKVGQPSRREDHRQVKPIEAHMLLSPELRAARRRDRIAELEEWHEANGTAEIPDHSGPATPDWRAWLERTGFEVVVDPDCPVDTTYVIDRSTFLHLGTIELEEEAG